ncbi:MAG: hypothetical protein BWY56_02298 [Acidobacteria bacterium ADurb.Bin340]|jgi:hypothetical protein|nr:MAG: hypothetical protein BWY56_02298 [Acidobacteria bacterium ADurb.Bin340]HOD32450.1 hypothetical protein [Holophaga sp.]
MAASKSRIDTALLLLRIAVGGFAVLQGLQTLQRTGWRPNFSHASTLGLALLKVVCGALTLGGLWMLPAGICLAALALTPGVQSLAHGGSPLAHASSLFHGLAALATGLAGGGRWSLGRG